MREVEIKVRLTSVKSFISKLDEKGIKLGEPKKQHDVVFGEPGAVENHLKANWLRIRTENDSVVYFTLKKSVEGHLDSIEHEVTVNESAELKNIILCLGYEPYSDLTKVRRKVKINDIEICLDEVPGLGNFVEAEKLVKENNFKILKKLPIKVLSLKTLVNINCKGIFPDFLNLDVEGLDEQIIRSIDFENSRPTVICLETISYSETGNGIKSSEIIKFIEQKGYMVYADTYINTIFVLKNKWLKS